MYWAFPPSFCGHPFQLLSLHHLFSFLCPSLPSILRFFSHPPAPGLSRTQTGGASDVELLLAFGPPLGPPSCAAFGVASAAPGFPNPFSTLAMSFRRLDTHQSCAPVGGRCSFSQLLILDLVLELKDRASRRKGISNAIRMPRRDAKPAISCGSTK